MAEVLVIEDDFIRDSGLRQALEKELFSVVTASSIDEAERIARERRPDFVISDIYVNGESAISFFEKLRKDEATRDTSIFVFFEKMDISTEKELKELKVFDLFSKSMGIRFLLEGLNRSFREKLLKRQIKLLRVEEDDYEYTRSLKPVMEKLSDTVSSGAMKDDHDIHYELGLSYMEMGLLKYAVDEFLLAARAPELFQSAYNMIAQCYIKKNKLREAIKALKIALSAGARTPESIGLMYQLGTVFLQMDRKSEALAAFKRVREKEPDFKDVSRKIEELEASLRKPSTA